jgi:hypothetical protein
VQRTRTTHQPVVVTTEETSEPLVVMLEMIAFERFQRRERQLFHLQLQHLLRLVETTEQAWQKLETRIEFVTAFRAGIRMLWEICPPTVNGFCAGLRMATNRLSVDSLTSTQLNALRTSLDLLRQESLSEIAIDAGFQKLTECGLSPTITGNAALVQMYMDDL